MTRKRKRSDPEHLPDWPQVLRIQEHQRLQRHRQSRVAFVLVVVLLGSAVTAAIAWVCISTLSP